MMRLPLFILSLLVANTLFADTYFIGFTDKQGTQYSLDNPSAFLSVRAMQRRTAQHINLDSLDLPVSDIYLDSLQQMGISIIYTSKWTNGAVVILPPELSINQIKSLSFVDTIQLTKCDIVTRKVVHKNQIEHSNETDVVFAEQAKEYLSMLHLDELHGLGHTGESKMIAVIDDGFYGADRAEHLAKVRENIIGTFDIIDPNNSVFDIGEHGAKVLSLLAAQKADSIIGTAPNADYCLIRTEDDFTESMSEVDNLVRAMEIADSIGADIISISLGYYQFDNAIANLSYSDMNGRTARSSRAATIAAEKGMLVCVAAGNEGNKVWHHILSPADAEGILTIGGVDINLLHSPFSSYGPTADGRTKPEVCALGSNVPIYYPNRFVRANGTSFSTPIIAGAAACLWSALPDLTVKEIRERIIRYSDRYLTPDNKYGYGIPDFLSAYYNAPTAVEQPNMKCQTITPAIYNINGFYVGTKSDNLPNGMYLIINQEGRKKFIK